MKRKKHLIIGSGPAALSAAETIRSLSPDDEIKLITSEKTLPYSPAALPYLLAGRLKAAGMWIRDEDYFRQNRLTFDRGTKVVEVLPREKSVRFKGGRIESYDQLLIASGAEPVKPGLEGLQDIDCLG
ncbi:MAG: FAD/NAD(P)-binding oxidoreductase, partial [Pseudomonadota bacterium]